MLLNFSTTCDPVRRMSHQRNQVRGRGGSVARGGAFRNWRHPLNNMANTPASRNVAATCTAHLSTCGCGSQSPSAIHPDSLHTFPACLCLPGPQDFPAFLSLCKRGNEQWTTSHAATMPSPPYQISLATQHRIYSTKTGIGISRHRKGFPAELTEEDWFWTDARSCLCHSTPAPGLLPEPHWPTGRNLCLLPRQTWLRMQVPPKTSNQGPTWSLEHQLQGVWEVLGCTPWMESEGKHTEHPRPGPSPSPKAPRLPGSSSADISSLHWA